MNLTRRASQNCHYRRFRQGSPSTHAVTATWHGSCFTPGMKPPSSALLPPPPPRSIGSLPTAGAGGDRDWHRPAIVGDGTPPRAGRSSPVPARTIGGDPAMVTGWCSMLRRAIMRFAARAGRGLLSPRPASRLRPLPASRDAAGMAARVAAHDVGIIIEGATGTGKEGLARLVHTLSPRRDCPSRRGQLRRAPRNNVGSNLVRSRARRLYRCHRPPRRACSAPRMAARCCSMKSRTAAGVAGQAAAVLQEREVLPIGAIRAEDRCAHHRRRQSRSGRRCRAPGVSAPICSTGWRCFRCAPCRSPNAGRYHRDHRALAVAGGTRAGCPGRRRARWRGWRRMTGRAMSASSAMSSIARWCCRIRR